MTSLQKIKEIEDAVPTIIDGMTINKRWAPTGSFRAKPFRDDFELLLKAFNVMREIAIKSESDAHSGYCSIIKCSCSNMVISKEIDKEFEEKMK